MKWEWLIRWDEKHFYQCLPQEKNIVIASVMQYEGLAKGGFTCLV